MAKASTKKIAPPTAKDYIQIKGGWAKDHNAFIAMQRNFFVVLSIAGMVGIIVAMIVIKSMVEKNAIEPYVISVNTADQMPVAIKSHSVKEYTKAHPAVVEFFIIKYIKAREGYTSGTYIYDYTVATRTMSSSQIYKQFRDNVINDKKNNPSEILKDQGNIDVTIKQIMHDQKSAVVTVRIAKKIYMGGSLRSVLNYSIKIHYSIDTSSMKVSDIEINPLGLVIDAYDATEEKTIVEDETFGVQQ